MTIQHATGDDDDDSSDYETQPLSHAILTEHQHHQESSSSLHYHPTTSSEPQQRVRIGYDNDSDDSTSSRSDEYDFYYRNEKIPDRVISLFEKIESKSFGLVVIATITYLIGLLHSIALRSQPMCVIVNNSGGGGGSSSSTSSWYSFLSTSSTTSTLSSSSNACSTSHSYFAEDFSSIFYGMGLFLCGSLIFQLIPLLRDLHKDYEPVRNLARTFMIPTTSCGHGCGGSSGGGCHSTFVSSIRRLFQCSPRLRDSMYHDLKEIFTTILCFFLCAGCRKHHYSLNPDENDCLTENEEVEDFDASASIGSNTRSDDLDGDDALLSMTAEKDNILIVPKLQIV